MRAVRRSNLIIDDPEINGYINTLGYKLLSQLDTKNTDFTFFVIDAPGINAFAGPGGYIIGIHSGLIIEAQSEGELAAVMAHEIAHVTQKHLARAVQKASVNNIQTTAIIIAAILLSDNPQLTHAAITASIAGNIQNQLNFSRTHENEADWLGIDMLAQAGYDPQHMAGFFERLKSAMRFTDSEEYEFLRTHPVTSQRIINAQNRAAKYGEVVEPPSPNFEGIKRKLRAQLHKEDTVYIQQLNKDIANTTSPNETDLYELSLLMMHQEQYSKALPLVNKLDSNKPFHVPYINLKAQLLLRTGHPEQAYKLLSQALALYPKHPALTTSLINTAILSGHADQAIRLMKAMMQEQGHFTVPSDYKRLALAYNTINNPVESYLAMAEYYYRQGLTQAAIDHLSNALQQLSNPTQSDYFQQRANAKLEIYKKARLEEKALLSDS